MVEKADRLTRLVPTKQKKRRRQRQESGDGAGMIHLDFSAPSSLVHTHDNGMVIS